MFYEVKNLYFSYYKSPLTIKNAHFTLNKNESVLLLASKSMGKTTALKVFSGFDDTYLGSITLDGEELKKIEDGKKNFSLLLSEPVFFENKSVEFNLNYAAQIAGMQSLSKDKILQMLAEFGLAEKIDEKVKKLSLFEKRKLAVARCLLKDPKIIFLDDQFDGLNEEQEVEFEKIYSKLIRRGNVISAAGSTTFLKHKSLLEELNFSKTLYLYLSEFYSFDSIAEFLDAKVKLDVMKNFVSGYNLLDGVIFRSNKNYSFAKADVREIELDGTLSDKLKCLKLGVGESEDVTLYFLGDLDFSNIENKDFNKKLKKGEILAFSNLDGSRIF